MFLLPIVLAAIWMFIIDRRGDFWLFGERDAGELAEPARWPAIVAVVPARDEADVIARSLGSLLAQDYPGDFRVILVDDQSSDGTAAAALKIGDTRLTVIEGGPRPAGWTGKLWALEQGIGHAGTPEFLWLTDADIGHASGNLRRLVARAGRDRLAMVSLMARLHCETLAERALIPAFVYFFAMLYPFGRVNDPLDKTAAAGGGCVLVRREVLAAAGGIASIRGEIIDDCALARRIKLLGPIWLGITERAASLRPYSFDEIRRMVARSAYAQLGYSPLLLLGTVMGMLLFYLGPVALAVIGVAARPWHGSMAAFLCLPWLSMWWTMRPVLGFYRLSSLWGFALPVIALAYAAFTLDSAVQHWRGRGGMWKGRAQALRA